MRQWTAIVAGVGLSTFNKRGEFGDIGQIKFACKRFAGSVDRQSIDPFEEIDAAPTAHRDRFVAKNTLDRNSKLAGNILALDDIHPRAANAPDIRVKTSKLVGIAQNQKMRPRSIADRGLLPS